MSEDQKNEEQPISDVQENIVPEAEAPVNDASEDKAQAPSQEKVSEEQPKEVAPEEVSKKVAPEEAQKEAATEEAPKASSPVDAASDDKVEAPSPEKNVEDEKAKSEIVKPQKPTNCPVCKKSMKTKWYYRNMKYYCCKGCYKQENKKESEANNIASE